MSVLLKRPHVAGPQAGFIALAELRKPWIERFMLFQGRTIPVAATTLKASDSWGGIKARFGVGRMRYGVLPGLYAVGEPVAESDVFVTANYKMSFDALRSSLAGLNAWILVLDTKGINVWCAAGKGTFGTDELVSRISKVKLATIVSHRRIILPQLGAPGVSAPLVAKHSGFRVVWGPVRTADIKEWLATGRVKSASMREVRFGFKDRMLVAPLELVHSWPLVPAALMLGLLFGLPATDGWIQRALPASILLLGTIPVGTVLFPALLPWLPARSFALKGASLGIVWAVSCATIFHLPILAALGGVMLSAPVVAFLALNFTGASTFTCQPGALLEVEKGFWPMIISSVAGLALASASRLIGA
jgi:hypothetical protein